MSYFQIFVFFSSITFVKYLYFFHNFFLIRFVRQQISSICFCRFFSFNTFLFQHIDFDAFVKFKNSSTQFFIHRKHYQQFVFLLIFSVSFLNSEKMIKRSIYSVIKSSTSTFYIDYSSIECHQACEYWCQKIMFWACRNSIEWRNSRISWMRFEILWLLAIILQIVLTRFLWYKMHVIFILKF